MLKSEIVHSEMFRAHCGNPWQAAAWTQQPLPPMPPPADLESAAPLPPFDNMINRSIREQVRRHPASKNAPRGARWGKGGCRLIECQEWWCENAQCHRVCFVMCLFSEGRRQGKRGSWWNDYIVAEREGGGLVLNSWQKPSLFNTVLQCPVESRLKSNKEPRDALHPSLVLLIVFHKITQFHRTAAACHLRIFYTSPDRTTTGNQDTV